MTLETYNAKALSWERYINTAMQTHGDTDIEAILQKEKKPYKVFKNKNTYDFPACVLIGTYNSKDLWLAHFEGQWGLSIVLPEASSKHSPNVPWQGAFRKQWS